MWVWILLMVASSAGQAVMADDIPGCRPFDGIQCNIPKLNSQGEEVNIVLWNIPDTLEKLKEQCNYTDKYLACVSKMADKCATEEEKKSLLELSGSRALGMNTELCREGSDLRKRYLANMNCYQDNSAQFTLCTQQVLENLKDDDDEKSEDEETQSKCCNLHKFDACLRNIVTDHCLTEAADLMEEAMRGFPTLRHLCNNVLGVPSKKCHQINASVSHNLSITLIFTLFFIVFSKAICFNNI